MPSPQLFLRNARILPDEDGSRGPSDGDSDSGRAVSVVGGLFLDPDLPSSFVRLISLRSNCSVRACRRETRACRRGFLSVSLRGGDGIVEEPRVALPQKDGGESSGPKEREASESVVSAERKRRKVTVRGRGRAAVNTTKHLWAGAIAAMVSRTFVAPLERLKLEYIVRGEQKNIVELVRTIAVSQGLHGFWKGNLVNILRTAPFKAINFYAYDTYRKQLLRFSGNDETTNFERFIAGAAAGITATVLCLPLDTIRTKLVARGGEALGGVSGAFRYMIHNEGFFSLYRGLVPSILSMAPSSAVFYGVYDILKSAYLHSPEGRQRIQNLSEQGEELNALDQLELGPIRTLFYGAISGACAEAATYPFEVVRRRLQLQVQATRLSAVATCAQIIENGGVPALYAGLIPSLLQVLPSAAISYFVYEFMKIVLKVE
ncbi:probable mitochondrial adenine nucleotide transporter BTL3 [Syzygium oleosum]|uniref:probable mitochondrial adenine nucleotide transporter BTL3 n=1 Tax=Syzygium oleosum TaxID=219896 RepID=UPI0011D22EE8|nr:probable mitochondrial adenine nucleotide transporter BTL3 [Syzygium oleosum]